MSFKKYTLIFLMIVLCAVIALGTSCTNNSGNSDLTESKQEEQTDDGDPFTFSTISELRNAIKKNPTYYNDNKITVTGTILEHDGDILLVDFNGSSYDAKEYSEIIRNKRKHIRVVISDDVSVAVLERGDYIKLNGTVRIANGEIYLDNCEYTMLITCDER